MSFLKKYWYLFLVSLITAGLGIMTYLTSKKLETPEPVAPTVPQEMPKAVSEACKLTFAITTATPTPTPTPGPTATPTPTPTPTVQPPPPPPPPPPVGVATPTPIPTPKVPVAGTGPSVLGASAISLGFLLVLLGLAF